GALDRVEYCTPSSPLPIPLQDPLPLFFHRAPVSAAVRGPRRRRPRISAGRYATVSLSAALRRPAAKGVEVHIGKRIEAMRQGKEMVVLLRSKVRGNGWEVRHLRALAKLEPIHDSLASADSTIDDLIRRTHPTAVRARRRRAGVHVGSPVRIAALDSASGRRRTGSPTTGSTTTGSPTTGSRNSAGRRRAGSPVTTSPNSDSRRRRASPAPIPFRAADKLRSVGKLLGKACLYGVQELGEDMVKVASKLMRVKRDADIATTRTSLIALKRKLNQAWASQVRVKDLQVEFA
ncbi:unnamed protein product, partial [Urochloa humidicola]